MTNIAAFVSSTQITLGTAASTAVSGADWAIYNTTVIGTACTGLSGLGLTAPMIESLSDPVAAVVSGTGPNGGPGGNETFLGWSGQNGYSTDVNGSYDAGFVLPLLGPGHRLGAARWSRGRPACPRWPRARARTPSSAPTPKGRARPPRPRPTPASSSAAWPPSRPTRTTTATSPPACGRGVRQRPHAGQPDGRHHPEHWALGRPERSR